MSAHHSWTRKICKIGLKMNNLSSDVTLGSLKVFPINLYKLIGNTFREPKVKYDILYISFGCKNVIFKFEFYFQ